MKYIIFIAIFLSSQLAIATWPAGHVIYNSTTADDQKISLGILPEGHMGSSVNNIATNADYTGIAYKMSGSWKDATTPGCLCEGWGGGARDQFGRQFHGEADEAAVSGGVNNLEVKSFVVDPTSMESIVWIDDVSGNPAMEVKHVFGPSALRPDELFEAVVTITNISSSTLTDVRYNRTMDWDIPPTEFSEIVTIVGAADSASQSTKPRVHRSGNNGFRNPNVFAGNYTRSMSENQDKERFGPRDHGFAATFEFDDLLCGEAHSFKIYYGAAETRALMLEALAEEGVSIYSLGEPNNSRTSSVVTYAFGFKGVSGTALAPTLPEKIAILPGGVDTDETKVQTYASPVIADGYAYQAIFKFRKDHQWDGDILRYELDDDGNFKDTSAFPPISAATKLKDRLNTDRKLKADWFGYARSTDSSVAEPSGGGANGGRGIWTVSHNPDCWGGTGTEISEKLTRSTYSTTSHGLVLETNNFDRNSLDALKKAINNCSSPSFSDDAGALTIINWVRGFDQYDEESPVINASDTGAKIRRSFLADSFHSDLVYVGPPVGSLSSSNDKTEAYFRNANGYADFKETHKDRPDRLYVGANDGMLHAYDKDLNELWAFIPPSILPKLRGLIGESGKTNTKWLVDGPIIVKDVYINAESKWKTVLVGGLGWGGKGYYVLDITDAWNPKHLFTIDNDSKNKQVSYWSESGYKTTHDYAAAPDKMDYSALGDTWARPSIILLPYVEGITSQRYVMAFGAGYAGGTATGLGNFVYVLDFEPSTTTFADPVTGTAMPEMSGGNVIKKIEITADSASDIPNGVTANMSVVTADAASTAEYFGGIAYFPDLTGQVWKLDMSKTDLATIPNDDMWTLSKAFRAEGTLGNDRFGYNQMATTLVKSTSPDATNIFQYFGTGDQAHIQRRDASIANRIFGVKDSDFPAKDLAITGTSKTISSDGIFHLTGDTDTVCSAENVPAWYADVKDLSTLDTTAGDFIKVVGRALVAGGDAYFTLYRPEDLSCPVNGKGEVLKMVRGCTGGHSVVAAGEGLSTAPVMDSKGNIYVGVSNLATDGELDIEASEDEERSGVDNILKIGSTDMESSGEAAGTNIKSWRELRRDN